jgi:predicted ATP-grasp superfamily ATP-dependent carboligase
LEGQNLKVIVYEHVSGGGHAGKPIPPSVLSEGFGMLRCFVEDFKAAGHEVTILMDSRLSKLSPPISADFIVPVSYPEESKKFLQNIAKINDAIYIIAPETGQTLQSLVELAEGTGKVPLNCESQAIERVADKAVFYETLQNLGVSPKTTVLTLDEDLVKVKLTIKKELCYPILLKPVDGVGCSGLSLVNEETQLASAIAKIRDESTSKRFVAQEFIRGEAASVSLLSTGKKTVALSLNKQNVTLAGPNGVSSYEGGTVPFDHRLKQEAFRVSQRVVEAFSGLRGYVGVDFVLTEHKVFVVDANPRLTTSYVGLRSVEGFNVTQALLAAVLKGTLPDKTEIEGYACFSKVDTPIPSFGVYQKAAKLSSIVSPPFPLNDYSQAVSLVIGKGANLKDATLHLEEAKKHLLNIIP